MNAPVKIETSEVISVEAFAKSAMDGVDTYEEGSKRLLAMARADPALMLALMEPYEARAARIAVRRFGRHSRHAVWNRPTTTDSNDRVVALVASNMAMLMDFPLPGGKLLRNATRDEVSDAANSYRKQAVDMVRKSA